MLVFPQPHRSGLDHRPRYVGIGVEGMPAKQESRIRRVLKLPASLRDQPLGQLP